MIILFIYIDQNYSELANNSVYIFPMSETQIGNLTDINQVICLVAIFFHDHNNKHIRVKERGLWYLASKLTACV